MKNQSLGWCWPLEPLKLRRTLANWMPGLVWLENEPPDGTNLRLPVGEMLEGGEQVRVGWQCGPMIRYALYYVPTVEDLQLTSKLFPAADPGNPPWLKVAAELVANGIAEDELRKKSALTLLVMLKKVRADKQAEAANDARAKRRGRKKADYETVQKEAKLAANWERARDAGVYKPDFAKDNKLTVKQLDALLDRVAKRKRLSE
jgi:hypothetical protein